MPFKVQDSFSLQLQRAFSSPSSVKAAHPKKGENREQKN